jgi:hypothetical protein
MNRSESIWRALAMNPQMKASLRQQDSPYDVDALIQGQALRIGAVTFVGPAEVGLAILMARHRQGSTTGTTRIGHLIGALGDERLISTIKSAMDEEQTFSAINRTIARSPKERVDSLDWENLYWTLAFLHAEDGTRRLRVIRDVYGLPDNDQVISPSTTLV